MENINIYGVPSCFCTIALFLQNHGKLGTVSRLGIFFALQNYSLAYEVNGPGQLSRKLANRTTWTTGQDNWPGQLARTTGQDNWPGYWPLGQLATWKTDYQDSRPGQMARKLATRTTGYLDTDYQDSRPLEQLSLYRLPLNMQNWLLLVQLVHLITNQLISWSLVHSGQVKQCYFSSCNQLVVKYLFKVELFLVLSVSSLKTKLSSSTRLTKTKGKGEWRKGKKLPKIKETLTIFLATYDVKWL